MVMGSDREVERVAAVCTQCGAVYAAVLSSDGHLRPIGRKQGCGECGCEEFDRMSVSDVLHQSDESTTSGGP